jgi:glyoxylase-like metal-dependent hydrolase (beta-lactamase superfamily II)
VDEPWREVGDRVYARRHAALDLNVGLVVGDGGCLVVDTRGSAADGRELADAVRRVTAEPWTVVTTHAHFDHCFGTSAFLPARVWGHARCAEAVTRDGDRTRERIARLYDDAGQPDIAADIRRSPLVPPDALLEDAAVVDVGSRSVELRHLGRGHTDHDVVVHVPDAGVVLAGDLVEEGAPPQFGDAFPLDWPGTLDGLLATVPAATVVPGHGDVVDRAFVAAQRDVLADAARRSAEGHRDGRPMPDVAAELRELGDFATQAVERAYRQLGPAAR